MTQTDEIALLKYDEALRLPAFRASLDRLLNRRSFALILSPHSVDAEDLIPFISKAISEGNALLVEREWNGYRVTVWKD